MRLTFRWFLEVRASKDAKDESRKVSLWVFFMQPLCLRQGFGWSQNKTRDTKGMTEDHSWFSNMEATGYLNTCSSARVLETKPAGSRLKGELKMVHESSGFCFQGHGLERRRWQRATLL